jgi:parallel beta-helix repeat protein
MTTSHVETVSVPSYWKNGLVENLDSGLKSASIQDAIDNASSGDTLKLWSWNYVENNIEVNERVTIMGNSSGTVTISANCDKSVFNITTNTITLKNLTLKRSSNSTDEACIKTTLGTDIKIDNVFMSNCGIGILVKTSDIVISNVTIEDSVTDGIVVKNTASNVRIENSTIKRSGDDGIQLESNVHLYNNTISSNTNRGIYVISGSDYAKIRYNTIDDNDEQGIYIFGVHHVEIRNNIIEDNENYGIQLKDANYTQISDNTVDDNDGGLRTESTYNCNITDSTFKDNNGKGIWFTTSSNGNNIRDTVASGSSSNDIELDDSKRNTGFNFTFGSGSIAIDSNSDFRVMNSLNIKKVLPGRSWW